MRIARRYGIASLCLAAGLSLAGCQAASAVSDDSAENQPATVELDENGGPATLRLTGEAVERLAIRTEPVVGGPGALTVTYAAVVYDANGDAWAFAELEPGVYRRVALTIQSVDGDTVRLAGGPDVGTPLVTVGAAELVGVEAGISGGE